MTPEYATYNKYYSPEEAQFLITLLQQQAIPYTLEHEVNQLDKVYLGETIEAMFALKVPGNRFNDIHALLAEQAKADFAQPGFDHYLQSYSAAELQEFLNDPIGWNPYDSQIAKMLLAEKTGEEETVQPVSAPLDFEPVKIDKKYITLAYIACFLGLTTYVYFGATGFFAGLAINQAQKTLQNGNTIKFFKEEDRKHGRNIMFLSIACMLVGCYIVYNMYFKNRY
jgi:hypothetical protein